MTKLIETIKQQKSDMENLKNDMPYNAWRMFGDHGLFRFETCGTAICVTVKGDFLELHEAREALNYWVELFGGKVNWEDVRL